jgi:ankyrin repeat protein
MLIFLFIQSLILASENFQFFPSAKKSNLSLVECCKEGHDKELKTKIKKLLPRDINLLDEHTDKTPLMEACDSHHPRSLACANLLLKSGKCDINQKNNVGHTALHYLLRSMQGDKLVRTFKRYGADALIKTDDGFGTIHYAAENKNPKVLNEFLEHFRYQVRLGNMINDVPQTGVTPLYSATLNSNLSGVKQLILINADLEKVSPTCDLTPVMIASKSDVLLHLIAEGAALTKQSKSGNSGLKNIFCTNPLLICNVPFRKKNGLTCQMGISALFVAQLCYMMTKMHPANNQPNQDTCEWLDQ